MVLGKMRPMKIIVKEARHGNSYSVMEYSDVRRSPCLNPTLLASLFSEVPLKRTLLGLTGTLRSARERTGGLPVRFRLCKNSTVTLYEQVSLVKNKFQTGELTAEIRIPDTISTMTRA